MRFPFLAILAILTATEVLAAPEPYDHYDYCPKSTITKKETIWRTKTATRAPITKTVTKTNTRTNTRTITREAQYGYGNTVTKTVTKTNTKTVTVAKEPEYGYGHTVTIVKTSVQPAKTVVKTIVKTVNGVEVTKTIVTPVPAVTITIPGAGEIVTETKTVTETKMVEGEARPTPPSTPREPEASVAPGFPKPAEGETAPSNPQTPETPKTPEAPVAPGFPIPTEPETPGAPAAPGFPIPADGEKPAEPAAPVAFGFPHPETPSEPSTPGAPIAPGFPHPEGETAPTEVFGPDGITFTTREPEVGTPENPAVITPADSEKPAEPVAPATDTEKPATPDTTVEKDETPAAPIREPEAPVHEPEAPVAPATPEPEQLPGKPICPIPRPIRNGFEGPGSWTLNQATAGIRHGFPAFPSSQAGVESPGSLTMIAPASEGTGDAFSDVATVEYSQPISLCNGATYRFSMWTKRSSEACYVRVHSYDEEANFPMIFGMGLKVGEWERVERTFVAGGNGRKFDGSLQGENKFAIGMWCPEKQRGEGESVVIDDVSLEVVGDDIAVPGDSFLDFLRALQAAQAAKDRLASLGQTK